MPVNNTGQRDPPLTSRLRLQSAWMVIATIAILWLVSCEPSGTPFSPASPEVVLLPTATIVPTTTTTERETAIDHAGTLVIVPPMSNEVGRFELLELEIQTDLIATNPFDPEELDIRVEFTSPSGKMLEIGAFWYHEFDYAAREFVGEPNWKARFTPTETGTWTAVARIPSHGLESAAVSFDVVDANHHGFVRVHPSNPRYFAFDDESFFFPIGLNLAWWSGAGDALSDYGKWMDLFAANGGNTIRVWMAEWSFGIEWNNTPLGDYSNRLQRAWLLDQIFTMAEERDIYIVLVLLNCADFNNWQTDGWNGNPYNVTQGGPLEKPEQFVTDPTARSLLQRRLNYIVNRWGYSTHLLTWEWWNEVNLAPFSDETLIPWLQEMTAFLRERDINQHLVTNSYAIRDLSPIWNLPELDIIQKHEYAHQVNSENKDLAERVTADFARLAASAPPKPILLGEFGYGTEGYGKDIDKSGIHLHNGIWATTFAGYTGSGMYWFWDVYVEAYNVWYHFRGLDRFLEDVDLSAYLPFSPLEINGSGGDAGQATGLGLRGDDVLIWLRSDAYTVQASEAAWERAGSPSVFLYCPPLVEGQVLTLRDMGDEEYIVHWFDPQAGTWLDPAEVISKEGILSIDIPNFHQDLAARIMLKQ